MKNVGPTRVELATRTIFNLLGPLSNPAGVKRQMVGVFSRQWVQPLAQVLKNLGAKSVWVVHGSDGLDEITLTGPTFVAALENGNIRTFEVTPEEAGLPRAGGDALKGGDAEANAVALAKRARRQAEPLPRCRAAECGGGADGSRPRQGSRRKAWRWDSNRSTAVRPPRG